MMIFFREIVTLLPLILLCLTILLVLLFILLFHNHFLTFLITVFGIFCSFISLYFVWKNGVQYLTNLVCIDGFSMLCMMLILIASFVTSIVSRLWLSRYCVGNYDEFYLLLLIVTIGSMVLINTAHVVTLFFGIELVSLPLCGLMSYVKRRKRSLEATVKYVISSGVSTAFLLFGIALIYAETTHLSFLDIYLELTKKTCLDQSVILMVGVVMVLIGLCFKLSLVPYHLWIADVYHGIPEIAGMCLATISKISVFSVFMRFFLLFTESSYVQNISYILMVVSCFSILFGSLMAFNQDNIKRILAYSSVSHMGYLLIGVIGGMKESIYDSFCVINLSSNSVEYIGIYLINYLFSILGVFSILVLFSYYYCRDREEDIGELFLYRGLFWRDPILSILFTLMVLAMASMPITLGFVGKFYLIFLSVKSKLWWCVFCICFGTIISMLYYLRIITVLYLNVSIKSVKYLSSSISENNLLGIKDNNVSSLKYVSYCNNDHYTSCIMNSFIGILVLIFSVLLLCFGIYPQCIVSMFSLIQRQF